MLRLLFSFIVLFCLPVVSYSALTPIARVDVVPYQRIEYGTTLNFGVVAFSKAGINRVEFTITGQGYSGGVKTARSMTLNPQSNVWEYWVPISSSEFTSDGVITVKVIAYGEDGGTRDIGATCYTNVARTTTMGDTSLVVNATGALAQPRAWVSTSGDNGTAQLNNKLLPYATLSTAITAIQAANGGKSDGAIVYFLEGTYNLGSASPSTTDEWLTITRDADASKAATILHGGLIGGTLVKVQGLTVISTATNDVTFGSYPTQLWVDDCEIIGAGIGVDGSNPVKRSDIAKPTYYTDTYIHDADYGVQFGSYLARNITIKNVSNDPFVMARLVINARVDNIDPGATYAHADGYQSFGDGPDNRIIYGYYGTNMHYQGLFLRQESDSSVNAYLQTPGTALPATDNAFVNIFMEMRSPGRAQYAGGPIVLSSGTISGRYDHLIMWNCTFPNVSIGIFSESSGFYIKNSSFVGNVFNELRDYVTGENSYRNAEYMSPGNADGNEFLHNHLMYSAVDAGTGSTDPPHWYSKSPDTAIGGSHTVGATTGLDLTDAATYVNFGAPMKASVLIDRIPFTTVPVDARNHPRIGNPDIGAIEHTFSKHLRLSTGGCLHRQDGSCWSW